MDIGDGILVKGWTWAHGYMYIWLRTQTHAQRAEEKLFTRTQA